MHEILAPGDTYGLARHGYPPASVVRDRDGRYYIQSGSDRDEITAVEAAAIIEDDQDNSSN